MVALTKRARERDEKEIIKGPKRKREMSLVMTFERSCPEWRRRVVTKAAPFRLRPQVDDWHQRQELGDDKKRPKTTKRCHESEKRGREDNKNGELDKKKR